MIQNLIFSVPDLLKISRNRKRDYFCEVGFSFAPSVGGIVVCPVDVLV
jgi:hypothetical protein